MQVILGDKKQERKLWLYMGENNDNEDLVEEYISLYLLEDVFGDKVEKAPFDKLFESLRVCFEDAAVIGDTFPASKIRKFVKWFVRKIKQTKALGKLESLYNWYSLTVRVRSGNFIQFRLYYYAGKIEAAITRYSVEGESFFINIEKKG